MHSTKRGSRQNQKEALENLLSPVKVLFFHNAHVYVPHFRKEPHNQAKYNFSRCDVSVYIWLLCKNKTDWRTFKCLDNKSVKSWSEWNPLGGKGGFYDRIITNFYLDFHIRSDLNPFKRIRVSFCCFGPKSPTTRAGQSSAVPQTMRLLSPNCDPVQVKEAWSFTDSY